MSGALSPGASDGGALRRSVLVVDDDRDIRETLQELLEQEGYLVATAKNGLDALARARDERPAVILLDLFMPEMDGMEFRQRQLLDPELAPIPVVVVSAAVGVEERVAALGISAHLEKPLQLERLLQIVAAHCTLPS
ncbi:MAG TPA: response regulator [Anaeromyxobacteraceae bacterium]|nr:response regulator [Anaeromyxobacteraceae bacterium]